MKIITISFNSLNNPIENIFFDLVNETSPEKRVSQLENGRSSLNPEFFFSRGPDISNRHAVSVV